MTVNELIEALKNCPGDMSVLTLIECRMTETKEKIMNHSEVHYLMRLVEKSEVPAWINRDELILKLQQIWLQRMEQKVV